MGQHEPNQALTGSNRKATSCRDNMTLIRQPLSSETHCTSRVLERQKAGTLSSEDSDRLLKSFHELLGAIRDQRAAFSYQVKQIRLLLRLLLPTLPADLSDIAVLLERRTRRHVHPHSNQHGQMPDVKWPHVMQAAFSDQGPAADGDSSASSSYHWPDATGRAPNDGNPVDAVALKQSLVLLDEGETAEALRASELRGLKESPSLDQEAAFEPLSVDELAEGPKGECADQTFENPRKHSCADFSYSNNEAIFRRSWASTLAISPGRALKSSRDSFEKSRQLHLMPSYMGNSQSTAEHSCPDLHLTREHSYIKNLLVQPNQHSRFTHDRYRQLRSNLSHTETDQACNSDAQREDLSSITPVKKQHMQSIFDSKSGKDLFTGAGSGSIGETDSHFRGVDTPSSLLKEETVKASDGEIVSFQDICDRIKELRSAVRLRGFRGGAGTTLPQDGRCVGLDETEPMDSAVIKGGARCEGEATGPREKAQIRQEKGKAFQHDFPVETRSMSQSKDVPLTANSKKQKDLDIRESRSVFSHGEKGCRFLTDLMYDSVYVAMHSPQLRTATGVKAAKKEGEGCLLPETEPDPNDRPPAGIRSALAGGRDSGAVPPLRDNTVRARQLVSRSTGQLYKTEVDGRAQMRAGEANAFKNITPHRLPSFCGLPSLSRTRCPSYIVASDPRNLEKPVGKSAAVSAQDGFNTLQAPSWQRRSVSVASQSSTFTLMPKTEVGNPRPCPAAAEVSSPSCAETPQDLRCASTSFANPSASQKRFQPVNESPPFWERLSTPKSGSSSNGKRNKPLYGGSTGWNIQRTQLKLRREFKPNRGYRNFSTTLLSDTRGKDNVLSENPVDACVMKPSEPLCWPFTQEAATVSTEGGMCCITSSFHMLV